MRPVRWENAGLPVWRPDIFTTTDRVQLAATRSPARDMHISHIRNDCRAAQQGDDNLLLRSTEPRLFFATFIAACASALIASVAISHAGFIDGNKLHEFCTAYPLSASGYVLGVIDTTIDDTTAVTLAGNVVTKKLFICLPENVVSDQLIDLACNYVRDHPEMRHAPASALVYLSAKQGFPCQ